jgi:hypothetical protein
MTIIPRRLRGVSRSSRHVGAGCDGCLLRQVLRHRAKARQRTAKSCGPGAATLALRRRSIPPATGARKAASPGRARISRKTIARGKPGCLGCTCQIRVRSCLPIAHGAAGAVGARLSLRPLLGGGQRICTTRADHAAGRRTYICCLETESEAASSSFSPCGRRWREAPDEGSASAETDPSPVRDASHHVHPLPQGERGRAVTSNKSSRRCPAEYSSAPCPWRCAADRRR